MAKKRSCRRNDEENKAHEYAVKIRKMTDGQIVEFITSERKTAYAQGVHDGLEDRKKESQEATAADFIDVLKGEKVPGIGAVTINKILEVAKKHGFIKQVAAG